MHLGLQVPHLDEFRDNNLPPPIYKSDFVKQLGKIAWLSDEKEIRKRARENWNLLFSPEESFMPEVSELIPVLHESNFIACRAHPWKSLFRSEEEMEVSMETLDMMVACGIDWIEPFAHKHSKQQINLFWKKPKRKSYLLRDDQIIIEETITWSPFHWLKSISVSS